ncbi:hypothetical protein G9A89_021190 [Geosiphon pyriformis]|nr:hypothetical protein G9A89_021190 [Geosiphon pyriformis]
MHICHYCVLNSKSLIKLSTISNCLPVNDTAANLLTANIPTTSLSTTAPNNLLAATTSNILTAAIINLSIPNISPNSAKSSYYDIRKPKIQNYSKLKISNSCLSTNSQLFLSTNRITFLEFENWNYLSLLVTPENAQPNEPETNLQSTLTSNILLAAVTENKSLAAIFPFELEETINPSLFSGAALEKKPITAMYTNAKVNGYFIKLILDSGSAGSIITRQLIDQLGYQVDHAASTRIITADGVTKTPIKEIDNFSIKINDIIVPIKVLVMKATQY